MGRVVPQAKQAGVLRQPPAPAAPSLAPFMSCLKWCFLCAAVSDPPPTGAAHPPPAPPASFFTIMSITTRYAESFLLVSLIVCPPALRT